MAGTRVEKALPMRVEKATPVLMVRDVEASAAFWEQLGFKRTAEVPHEGALGFVILSHGPVELMYQSEASVRADIPAMADLARGAVTSLFVEVSDLDAAAAAVRGAPEVLARRTTFYGMHEIGVREPGGHIVILAQRAAT